MDDVRTEIMRSGLAPDRRRRLFERLTEDDVVAVAGQGEEALRRAVAALVEAAMRQA
jgi:hypothetical protein